MTTAEEILSQIINDEDMSWRLDSTDDREKIIWELSGCVILPAEAEGYIDSLQKTSLAESIEFALDQVYVGDHGSATLAVSLLERVRKELL